MKMLLDYFRARLASILDSIHQVVEIESPSYEVQGSRAVVDWFETETRKISCDFEVERITAEDLGEHFLVRAFSSNEKPVLLLGHTDTVHPLGTKEKIRRASRAKNFTVAEFSI
ncbi:MAG: hypothetical protein WKF71_06460 [Pyrinomonadaceae bacterium]